MASPLTIRILLPAGTARGLRIADIGNWSGLAMAAPRTGVRELLDRPECDRPGVYVLTGTDPASGDAFAYIGEAESIRDRLPGHAETEFWTQAFVFVSKDESLTKAHARFLERALLQETKSAGRYRTRQNEPGGARLPEADRADMEAFLERIRQILPALGADLLDPLTVSLKQAEGALVCEIKGAKARGRRTAGGFIVVRGSTAVRDERPSAQKWPHTIVLRRDLIARGILVEDDGLMRFTKDFEFSSPSAAAAVIHGGSANGLISWRTTEGRMLKEVEDLAAAEPASRHRR